MPNDVWDALTGVCARIATLAARDDELRHSVRAFAEALLALTDGPKDDDRAPATDAATAHSRDAPAPKRIPAKPDPVPPIIAADEAVLPIEQAVAALRFASPASSPRPAWQDYPSPPGDGDLPKIAARCRLKADGARWAAERERRIAAGTDFNAEIAPTDREIIARARAVDGCYLWMNSPEWIPPEDLTLLERLAGCFDVLADALDAAADARAADGAARRTALELVAETQSAVWAAVARLSTRPDPDQEKAFIWLRETTSREGIFLPRHMRRDDPADPSAWHERAERVARFAATAGAEQDRERQRRKLLKKLDFIASRCAAGEEDLDYGRERFVAAAEELLALGMPPSNAELCDLTAALFDPSDLPPAEPDADPSMHEASPFGQVLRETARRRERLRSGAADEIAGPAGQEGPTDVEEAVRRIETEFPHAVVFALNGRSHVRGNPFEEPDRLYAALRFLATTYRDARLGVAPCPDLDAECRRQSGFWYRPHQSDTALGMFADDYQTVWEGRTHTLSSHLGKGVSKEARYTFRVAFEFDELRRVVVVGFLGQHQRTRAT